MKSTIFPLRRPLQILFSLLLACLFSTQAAAARHQTILTYGNGTVSSKDKHDQHTTLGAVVGVLVFIVLAVVVWLLCIVEEVVGEGGGAFGWGVRRMGQD
jgi:hypothetical protein